MVRAYTEKHEPISSKYLVETYDLSLSSATIRNEMAALEELGYIIAPHTSAGRVPTENGYRYFVRRIISGEAALTSSEQQMIAHRFQALPTDTEQWMRFAATALARTAQTASLVIAPNPYHALFKHLELISVQGRLVLMVLVLQGGTVHQRMLELPEPVSQVMLSEAAARVNALCADLNGNEMLTKMGQLNLLEREVLELAAELVKSSSGREIRVIYRDGLSEVITTFADSEGAQQALRVFEERAFLNMILDEFLSPVVDGVQVVIAGEGRRDEINQLSMVLSRYGVPGKLSGAIGVLGPTHINYGRAISTVRYVASLMSGLMQNFYPEEDSEDK